MGKQPKSLKPYGTKIHTVKERRNYPLRFLERKALHTLFRGLLHLVELRRGCGREVQMHARMALQLSVDKKGFMGTGVVQHQVQLQPDLKSQIEGAIG